jgi:MoaA/NifB/PqqE/SkfB family radical SAM enzyme
MDIIVSTNGMLLTERKAAELINAGVTHILFSIDAATSETYELVRCGGVFEIVLRAIDTVNRIRSDRLIPVTRASFVKSRLNYHEADLFAGTARPSRRFGGMLLIRRIHPPPAAIASGRP